MTDDRWHMTDYTRANESGWLIWFYCVYALPYGLEENCYNFL